VGFLSPAELADRIAEVTGRPFRRTPVVTDDTTNYMNVQPGMVLRLGEADYYVTGDAKEGRFGIADQPKFWVKYAIDLQDGSRKIIKLVFLEEFPTSVGPFTVRCTRNPDKEARVLDCVRGDHRFMQGKRLADGKGNNVRVIDFIRGKTLYNYVASLEVSHREYTRDLLPQILEKVAVCIDALAFLQDNGLEHGDVRNDHIIIESETGLFRWIDFDYEVNYQDFDVWSVGNILSYVVGKGLGTMRDARELLAEEGRDPRLIDAGDALVFFKHRLACCRKIYPYLPEGLDDILHRFSASTESYYDGFSEISSDLRAVLDQWTEIV